MTDPSGSKAGRDVAKPPVQSKVQVNMAGAKEIPYSQWSGWYDKAKAQLGIGEVPNGKMTPDQIIRTNAVRNQLAATYMNSVEGADAFVIRAESGRNGQSFFALKDNAAAARVNTSFQTTRGGSEMVADILTENARRPIVAIGKTVIRAVGHTILIEATSWALAQKHKASMQYARDHGHSAYADVGFLYQTNLFDWWNNLSNTLNGVQLSRDDYMQYNRMYKTNFKEKEFNSMRSYNAAGY